jgi:thioredoxin 1
MNDMSTHPRILPWVALAAALTAVAAGCGDGRARPGSGASVPPTASSAVRLPRLVDVGARKCLACTEMAPILEQLRTDFAGRMEVEFVDVWLNPDAAEPYRIRLIPTQIFYSADGAELSRHEGFMSRESILSRWRVHGVSF